MSGEKACGDAIDRAIIFAHESVMAGHNIDAVCQGLITAGICIAEQSGRRAQVVKFVSEIMDAMKANAN